MLRFIYERSVTNIREWSLAYYFICMYLLPTHKSKKETYTYVSTYFLNTYSPRKQDLTFSWLRSSSPAVLPDAAAAVVTAAPVADAVAAGRMSPLVRRCVLLPPLPPVFPPSAAASRRTCACRPWPSSARRESWTRACRGRGSPWPAHQQ